MRGLKIWFKIWVEFRRIDLAVWLMKMAARVHKKLFLKACRDVVIAVTREQFDDAAS